nr:hypothetical protein BaRGS_012633 [Batillaria attramentaria]
MPVLSSRCEQLRAADLIDYQAVMAIDPDIHSGLDQLPYDYPSFVTGPGIRGYIYTMGTRVVGFASIHLVDGKQTLTGLAGRFSPDCRAEGMYARFARSMLQGYQGLPELRYNTQTIADYGTLVARPRKWLQGGRKVLDKDVHWEFPAGKIPSNILTPADDEELCIAELSDYQAVMGIDPNIHMGLDRLPYHYPSYVHGPGVRAFIYKKGNKVSVV